MNETIKNPKSLYEAAGVSIDRGDQLVEQIKSIAKSTHIEGVMGGLGSFGALFDLNKYAYDNPVLVAGADGVGTKIKLAIQSDKHDTIGIDLVAMCVNDLLTLGARPLFFLDYFASSRLDVTIATRVIKGIAEGCKISGCALTGGETAEMPGMYSEGDYDLAGFCVGIVEKSRIIDGSQVNPGDLLLGLPSSGLHSNGYSLVRKILTDLDISADALLGDKTLIDRLMVPTRIYANSINTLLEAIQVKAIAHITGGGLIENIPRVLPDNMLAEIDAQSWQWPEIFQWLQDKGNIESSEMYRTFNCGIGMVICIAPDDKPEVIDILNKEGEQVHEIGRVTAGQSQATRVVIS